MLVRWLTALVLSLCAVGGGAQGLVPVPALSSHVVDVGGLLRADQLQALEIRLSALEAESGAQVVILIVSSTHPEDIASFGNRIGNSWKIGRKGVGDGLLLIVAKDDRKLRFEVAKSLEGAIPDLAARQIIDDAISPRFKQGDYAGGLEAGIDRVAALIREEALPSPVQHRANPASSVGFDWQNLIVFVFFGVFIIGSILRRVLGNKLGSVVTGGAVGFLVNAVTGSILIAAVAALAALLFVLISSAGSALRCLGGGGFGGTGSGGGWSSGSDSDPGFSSGGGGDFGGGGASGDW